MPRSRTQRLKLIAGIALPLVGLAVLYALGRRNYLVFHVMVEMFAVVVGCGIFMIAWNSRRFLSNDYFLFIGSAYLFVAVLDMVHTLAYENMGLFQISGTNAAAQLWVAARLLEAVSLPAAFAFLRYRLRVAPAVAGLGGAFFLLLASIFWWDVFPDCYVAGTGLTAFKVASEYVIIALLGVALTMLVLFRRHFSPLVLWLLGASVVVTALSEWVFTAYASPTDAWNMTGHFLKLISFYLIYKALIETGLRHPYELMFRDLRKHEQALIKSERWFRTIADFTYAWESWIDPKGNYIYCSPACERITGYAAAAFLDDPGLLRRITHPDDRHLLDEHFSPEVLRSHTGAEVQFRIFHKDGRERWIGHVCVGITDEDGEFLGRRASNRDITKRKLAEDELRHERDFVAAVLDTAGALVVVMDREGRIVHFNRACERVSGYTVAEVAGRRLWDVLIPARQADDVREAFAEIHTGAAPRRYEHPWAAKTGRRRRIEWSGATLRDPAGDVEYVIATGLDVTVQRRAQSALRRNAQRMHVALLNAPVRVFNQDRDLRYTWVYNSRQCRTQSLRIGAVDADVYPEPLAAKLTDLKRQVLERGEGVREELTCGEGDAMISYDLTLEPLTGANGQVVGLLGAELDVTDHKLAEEALRAAAADLQRSNRDLEEFAYAASHDLQEPLRMVTGYLQLLERRYKEDLDEDAEDFIDFAVEGAVRMQSLIEGLLRYSRVGTRGREMEPTDAGEVLEDTIDDLSALIERTDAQITHDPLPMVHADPVQLGQLLQNLLANAVKFHKPDQPPTIHVWAEPEGDRWRFAVRDRGIGIDEQYRERIFVIFQRLHTRADYPGTGIGLALCQKIVERHGGHIWVESDPGRGATFYFTLRGACTT